jgi:hypothetical protein
MKTLYTKIILFGLFCLLGTGLSFGQTSLPLSRTVWDGSTPTGWTDSGTGSYTSTFACSGSNGGRLDDTGDSYTVFFSGTPGDLDFELKGAGFSGGTFILEESANGSTYTNLNTYTSISGSCVSQNFTLASSTRYVRWRYSNKSGGNISIDDVSISAGTPACSGQPTAQATDLSFSNETDTTIDVSWTAGTGGDSYVLVVNEGSTVTFEPTDDSDYTGDTGSGDFSAAIDQGSGDKIVFDGSGTSATVSGLSPSTTYFFQVFHYCENGGTEDYIITDGTGNDGTQTTDTTAVTYCTGGPTSNLDSEIENVSLDGEGSADINNDTTNSCTGGSGGVINDFTAQSADLEQNGTYTVSVEFGDCDTNLDEYDGAGGVWIDWNADGDFDDANEEIGTADVQVSQGNVTENFTINVPAGQQIGSFRMRIVQEESGSSGTISPCGTFTYGSIEDYTVNVIASTSNSSESDIIASTFTPTDNIDYTSFSAVSGLTTANAVKIGEFEIRDGGSGSDSDGVSTILNEISFDILGNSNLAALAIFDGSSNISEITSISPNSSFTGLTLTAADDGTKTFDVYATFLSSVTDNERIQLTISSAVADGVNGSVFSSVDASGATTPTTGDNNRIEVTATALIFDQDVSNVQESLVMSPSPIVQAVDANANLDLDSTASVSVSITTGTTTFDAGATTSVNAVAGIATFDDLVFDTVATGNVLTASSTGLTDDTSASFDVTALPIVIALQDFDATSPSWNYTNSIDFFGSTSNFGDDFYGIIDINDANPINQSNFTNNILGENDLNSPNGTTGFAITTFEEISIVNFSNVVLTFDWQVVGYNAGNDDAKYEIIVDGSSVGEVFLVDGGVDPEDGSDSVTYNVPPGSETIELLVSIRNDGGSGYSGFDNFQLTGNYDGDLIYSGGTWSPSAPTSTSSSSDALIQDGTYTTSGNVSLNSISVLGDAVAEISSSDVLTIASSINNNGTLTFKSDASGSAQLADATGIDVRGDVSVERYMSNNRAFRLAASAVTTTDFIANNWQQNTHITGSGGSTNGFDDTANNSPSMFTFDNSNGGPDTNSQNDDYNEILNTSATNLVVGTPYVLFVRGDRNVDLTSNTASSATTLSATGDLHVGEYPGGSSSVPLSDQPDYWSLVANPYQAKVDYDLLTKAGDLRPDISVYDPANKSYESLTTNRIIKPGQSFWVQNAATINTNPSIYFEEADKVVGSTNATVVFSADQVLAADLELYNQGDDTRKDVLKFRFNENYDSILDDNDFGKLLNSDENLATNFSMLLSVDRRAIPLDNDIVPLFTNQYQDTNYEFRINLENWDPNIEIFVQDNYLNSTTEITPNQAYAFSVDSNIPESIAEDRFSLVFDNTTLGVEDNSFGAGFSLYPNPTQSGNFSVKTPNLSGDVQVEIINLLGQQVSLQNLNVEAQEVSVNAENLSSGIYVVKVTQDGQSFSAKLMVE